MYDISLVIDQLLNIEEALLHKIITDLENNQNDNKEGE